MRALVAWFTALVTAMFVLAALPAAADATFPELNGRRVVDDAHLLSAADTSALTAKLEALEARNTDQMVIVTVPSLQGDDIEDYGVQLGRKWGIGQKGQNNGVLLIVAPTEHKVRIEVGYGLEDVLTDALSSVIIQDKILPRFKANDFPGGVKDGTDAIVTQLSLDKPAAIEQAKAKVKAHDTWNNFLGWLPHILIFGFVIGLWLLHGLIPRRLQPLWFLNSFHTSWGGDSGGWSGGGGGFSGGGGSFGGGGASGSW